MKSLQMYLIETRGAAPWPRTFHLIERLAVASQSTESLSDALDLLSRRELLNALVALWPRAPALPYVDCGLLRLRMTILKILQPMQPRVVPNNGGAKPARAWARIESLRRDVRVLASLVTSHPQFGGSAIYPYRGLVRRATTWATGTRHRRRLWKRNGGIGTMRVLSRIKVMLGLL